MIVSALHVRVDHHNWLEVIVIKRKASATETFADHLIGTKGVKHETLSLTSAEKDLPTWSLAQTMLTWEESLRSYEFSIITAMWVVNLKFCLITHLIRNHSR